MGQLDVAACLDRQICQQVLMGGRVGVMNEG